MGLLFPFPRPPLSPTFRVPVTFASSPLSESLEQANHSKVERWKKISRQDLTPSRHISDSRYEHVFYVLVTVGQQLETKNRWVHIKEGRGLKKKGPNQEKEGERGL